LPKKYKLLVLDIDGTIMDGRGIISDVDKKALERARAAGIRVSLSTGRASIASKMVLRELALDGYHIFYDGALVCNAETGEEVYADPLDKELVRQLIGHIKDMDINVDFYSATHYFIRKESWASEIRRKFYGLTPTLVDFTNLWQHERIIKSTLLVASPEEKAAARDFYLVFKDRLHFSWTSTPAYPEVDFINIVSPDVSKGTALKALAAFLKIPMDEVVAIGDGTNDIPLLATAGLAIAMENASEALKKEADCITKDVEHSGVAGAIEKYLL
jgi:5-amino-6-(5-phospho-D-ribitylamino)uracil phosphatase